MRIPNRLLGAAALAIGLAGPLHPASAALEPSDLAAIDCAGVAVDSTCTITIAPGLGLLAPRQDVLVHEDGRGFDLVGDLSIPTGGDPVALQEASLSVRLGVGDRVESLIGLVRTPMPNGGFLGPVEVTERPLAAMGFAAGRDLLALEGPIGDAPLADERSYFFFEVVARFAAELPPISMQSPGGAGVVVLDPTDPFFYVAGEVQGLGGDGQEKPDADASADGGSAGSADGGADASAANGDGSAPNGDPNASADPNADPNAESQPEDGDDAAGIAGFAFSLNGWIPFDPVQTAGVGDRMPSFDGHFFQRTSMPLSPLPIEATGEFVFDLDPDRDGDTPFTPEAFAASPDLAYGINGALDVSIPFLKFFEFGFPLGDASAAIQVSEDDVRAAFSGLVTDDEFLPGLPVPIRPTGGIQVYGVLASKDLLHSYIHAEGQMGIDAGALGRMTGVPLGELYSQDAILDITAAGLSLQGSTSVGIHPSVKLAGESGFEVFISPWGESRIAIRGNFIIAGEVLENAEMVVDRNGVRVNGRFLTSGYAFEMEGELRGDGYLLAGSAALADPIETNAQDVLALTNEILAKREVVAGLEISLSVANDGLSAVLPAFQSASSAVASAQSAVDSIQSSINYHSSKASSYYSSYKSWKSKSCKWYDAACQSKRAYYISYYYGKYSYHVGVRSTLYVSRTAALEVLSFAKSKLDAIASGVSSARAAVNLAQQELDTAIAALRDAEARLAALPRLDGSLEMIATIGIENDEVWGAVEGNWNGQRLTDGYVQLGNPGEACLLVPTMGTLCSDL
ncbi:MAG: hypothetical protein H6748_03250 [Spirochaetaceae bacterium]|nr:hypothetical protein [Spirochaetaceae bacterium]